MFQLFCTDIVYRRRLLLILECQSVVVRRQANQNQSTTMQTPKPTTTRDPFIDPYDPINMNYNPPRDMTWLELGYNSNFDKRSVVPATLEGKLI